MRKKLAVEGHKNLICPIVSENVFFILPKKILIISYVQLVAGKTDFNTATAMTLARRVFTVMRVKPHAAG